MLNLQKFSLVKNFGCIDKDLNFKAQVLWLLVNNGNIYTELEFILHFCMVVKPCILLSYLHTHRETVMTLMNKLNVKNADHNRIWRNH